MSATLSRPVLVTLGAVLWELGDDAASEAWGEAVQILEADITAGTGQPAAPWGVTGHRGRGAGPAGRAGLRPHSLE